MQEMSTTPVCKQIMTNLPSFSSSRQSTALVNAQSKHKRTEPILFGLAKKVVHCDFRGLDFAQLALKVSINITENSKVMLRDQ